MQKGVYHFRTHEQADADRTDSLVQGMAATRAKDIQDRLILEKALEQLQGDK